jgi:plasmid maintenance system antidote protein VapI
MKAEIQAAIAAATAPARANRSNTVKLMDAAMSAQGIPSYYKLARVLGVSNNTMTKWKQERSAPADSMAARLAEMAGLDPDVVLAELAADRAGDDETRARWRGIAERLRRAGVAALMGGVFVLAAPAPEARAIEVAHAVDQSGLCVMSTRRRERRRGGGRRKHDVPGQRRRGPKASPALHLH